MKRTATGLRKASLAFAITMAIGIAHAASAASVPLASIAPPTALRQGDALAGVLDATQPVHVEIAMRLRNRADLDAFIAAASGRRIIDPAEFSAHHEPTPQQVQAVADWLRAQGFTRIEVAPNRLLVSADGTAAAASRAFATTLRQVRTRDGRIAFANTDDIHVPSALQGSVLAVLGLQTVHMGHTFAQPVGDGARTQAGTTHNPVEFSSIYGGTGAPTAAGVTVGIFTSGRMTQVVKDLNAFTTAHGFAKVKTQTVNTLGAGTSTSGVDEWDLDSQGLLGMAGGEVGKIVWYQTPSLSEANLTANFNAIVAANAAKIVVAAIGQCETDAHADGTAAAQDQIFATAVAQGQTIAIPASETQANNCGNGQAAPSWPASSQYVIAVAGTTLNATKTTWSSEAAWVGGGGGKSSFEPKPSWQTLWTGNHRGVADVAFDANPASGALVLASGSTIALGSDGLAASIFAGGWARALAASNQTTGFAGLWLYQLPAADFHDVASGTDFGGRAKIGYDLASGRGSMIFSRAIADLTTAPGNQPPVANFSYSAMGDAPGIQFYDTSNDPDGTIVAHAWNFGDGTTSTLAEPNHTYALVGTYSVSETVTDNDGAADTKTLSIPVDASGPEPQFLFDNTGFETTASWSGSSGVVCATGCNGESAHAGNGFAWLDGYGSAHTDTLSQQTNAVILPGTATLRFYLHVDTAETATTAVDKLTIEVDDSTGKLLRKLATYSNLDKSTGYVSHSFDLSPYAGQKVTVKFTGVEDSSLQTSFVVDDVSLVSYAP